MTKSPEQTATSFDEFVTCTARRLNDVLRSQAVFLEERIEGHPFDGDTVGEAIAYVATHEVLCHLTVTPPPGWEPFGSHANDASGVPLEFFGQALTADGLPMWERIAPARVDVEAT